MIITIMIIGHTALSVQLSVLSRWGNKIRLSGNTVQMCCRPSSKTKSLFDESSSLTGREFELHIKHTLMCLTVLHVGSQEWGLGTPNKYLARKISWHACQSLLSSNYYVSSSIPLVACQLVTS